MARPHVSYPVKATSRSVTRKRAKRLSWFVVGTAFGISCASALSPVSSPSVAVAAVPAPTEIAAVSTSIAPTAAPAPAAPAVAQAETPAPVEIASAPEPEPVVLLAPVAEPQMASASQQPPASEDTANYPLSLELKVTSGDTLITMLTDAGVAQDEAHSVLQAARKFYDPRRMEAGQRLTVELDKKPDSQNPMLTSLSLPLSLTSSVEVIRGKNNNFSAKKVEIPLERRVAQANGTISSSLYQTASDLGIPSSMVGEIINAYSYDVDFQRDIQPGNAINVLYEKLQTSDGTVAGAGNLIFAELTMNNRTLKVYRYTDKNGFTDYYNEAGESIRKGLLRTPINGARISSGYGQRKHPIMGYSRMHRGIDFAAPTGTPIYAAGDGVVAFAGRKGGYGNYLQLKHTGKYASAYAHVSRFASGIKQGKRVKQGDIIAYVGSTGASTGPHLHYEILVNGAQVNPSGVKFKTGNVLRGTELAQFKKTMERIEAMLSNPRGKMDIAMADFEREISKN